MRVVRVGNLDDPSSITPSQNIWVSSAPKWACMDEAMERVERQPAPPTDAPKINILARSHQNAAQPSDYDFRGESYKSFFPNLHRYPATMLPQIGVKLMTEFGVSVAELPLTRFAAVVHPLLP